MGQARVKKNVLPNGVKSVSNRSPDDPSKISPPTSNTGGKVMTKLLVEESQTVTDRQRINISVPDGIHACLAAIASTTGMSLAQVALYCLVSGLPAQAAAADAVRSVR